MKDATTLERIGRLEEAAEQLRQALETLLEYDPDAIDRLRRDVAEWIEALPMTCA